MVRAALGRDGGAFHECKETSIEETYPCYGIPIKLFLQLDEWVPHQELLAEGKLVRLGEHDDQNVIFVSHQWCSFNHPDPAGAQLIVLQKLLEKLAAGTVCARTNAPLECMFGYKQIDGPAVWNDFVDNGFIWHDFSCIPQPLAHKAKVDRLKAEAALAAGQTPEVSNVAAPGAHAGAPADAALRPHAGAPRPHAGAPRPHAGMLNADHRKGKADDDEVIKRLTEQLKCAVDSIPGECD